jgi:arylsulfatase A-like enzyme
MQTQETQPRADRPNILLIMTDQQRTDSLSCYGGTAIDTPNIDRLASEGVRFENCYANNPSARQAGPVF